MRLAKCWPFTDSPGFICLDINECSDSRTCPENSLCVNELGTYTCQCLAGFYENECTGDQCEEMYCEDIDECDFNNGDCEQD